MTGLIYVILIAIWAAVLVPRFLRRHDEMRRPKGSERLAAALAPEADHAHDAHRAGSWAEYVRSLTDVRSTPWVAQLRAPQSRHARRRRMIVLSLSGAVMVSMLGAVVGLVPGFIAAIGAIMLGAYVTAMFTQMRRWEAAGSDHVDSSPTHLEAGPTAAQRSTDGVRVVAARPEKGGAAWEPRQTTLPTYVSKSKASRIPRRIDLTGTGWTGAEMLEEARRRRVADDGLAHFDREFEAVDPDEAERLADYGTGEPGDEGYYRRAVNE